MLTIKVDYSDGFDDETGTFVEIGGTTIDLEHSLISLSKWESIWEKPFLAPGDKTDEEVLSYLECMALDPKFPRGVFSRITNETAEEINAYIDKKMSATWFNEPKNAPRSREVVTSELVYYWMIAFQIPITCETWHLNRLLTLIKVCNLKNAPQKKLSRSEIAERNRTLNEQRRAQMKTQG